MNSHCFKKATYQHRCVVFFQLNNLVPKALGNKYIANRKQSETVFEIKGLNVDSSKRCSTHYRDD